MKILTSHSLDTLRIHLYSEPKEVKKDFDQLAAELDLKFVELPININVNDSVALSGSRSQPISEEVANVVQIGKSLKGLSSLLALDERLWVTVTLSHHRDYFLSRWFDDSGDVEDAKKSIDNHLFATTSRRFIRDQAISRLWWASKIAGDLNGFDSAKALETMFWNSELLSQITSRPSTASSSAITREVVRIMYERKTKGWPFDRAKFRKLMASLDLALGRNLMFSLPDELLRVRIERIAKGCLDG